MYGLGSNLYSGDKTRCLYRNFQSLLLIKYGDASPQAYFLKYKLK